MTSGELPSEPTAPSTDPSDVPESSTSGIASSESAVNAPAATASTDGNSSVKPKRKAPLPRMGPGPLAARGLGIVKPASPEAVSTDHLSSDGTAKPSRGKKSGGRPASPSSPKLDPAAVEAGQDVQGKPSKRQSKGKTYPRPRLKGEKESEGERVVVPKREKVAVPSIRAGLSEDLEAELEASLAGSDVESYLGGSAGLPDRKGGLEEGTRVHAQIIKIHDDTVFVSLGGPDEGAIPLEQFTSAEPAAGSSVEVLVRGLNSDDGLYACTLPGSTIDVNDWGDIDEGSIVEAVVTGHNSGGLECKIGSIAGFMPISQVTEYRVEDLSEFVDQKMVCLVMEANQRRGNLVLSRRAVLEREREEKRREQLEELQAGDVLEGTVRSVRDFGAFVDLGGVDGLIHVSRLSWERIKHPSDVIEEGQKVKVKVDKIDKQSGKIALSYRDLLENPWDAAEATFDVGSVHSGTVTRTAPFGCFVKLAAGVEGLVHISELAHHRISRVDTFVSEGDTVEVKVLSFDRDSQKIGLSIKAAQAKPSAESAPAEESEEPVREMAVPARTGPLKGGNNRDTGGERFGLRW